MLEKKWTAFTGSQQVQCLDYRELKSWVDAMNDRSVNRPENSH